MADYSELIRRAIAKDKGLPYEPVDNALASFDAAQAPGVDDALQSFDAAQAAPPVEQPAPPPVAAPAPAAVGATKAVNSDLVQRAIARDKGVPYQAPALPPPVTDEVDGAPATTLAAESAPVAAGGVIRVVEPPAQRTEVVRVIEPKANATAEQPDAAPAAESTLTLQPTIQSAQQDAQTIVSDSEGAVERIAEAREADSAARAKRSNDFLAEFDTLAKEQGDAERAAFEGYRQKRTELDAINREIRALPPITDGRTGAGKAAGGIAVGLGQWTDHNNLVAGLMQGMNVQTNNAGEIQQQLNTAAEREIALQQKNLENKRAEAQDKLTELGVARQYIQDSQQAFKFATAVRKERLAGEMDAMTHTLNSDTARDAAVLEIAKLRADARKEMNDILQTEMGAKAAAFQAIALGKMTPDQAASWLGGSGNNASLAAEAKTASRESTINKSQEQLAQGYQDAGSKLAPGLFVADAEVWNRKKTEDKAKELKTDFQSRELRRQLADMRKFIADNPDYSTDLQKRSTLESQRAAILATYKDAKELGALDNGVERVVNRAIGDPTGTFDTFLTIVGQQPTALARIDEQIREADAAIAARRDNNGLGNIAPAPVEPEPAKTRGASKPAPKPAASATAKPRVPRRDASSELE